MSTLTELSQLDNYNIYNETDTQNFNFSKIELNIVGQNALPISNDEELGQIALYFMSFAIVFVLIFTIYYVIRLIKIKKKTLEEQIMYYIGNDINENEE